MSYNPAMNPQDDKARKEQQRIDEQYARDVANNRPLQAQQQYGYNQPGYVQPPVQAQPHYVQQAAPAVQHGARHVGIYDRDVDVQKPKDRVRWGPIIAGIFTTLATFLLLSLLGVAIGLTAATGYPNGGAPAAATNAANNYGTGAAIWAAISALIAFFLGGYVAARTSAVRGRGTGWTNGALVWAVTLPLLLWLASNGATGFLNAIGFNLGGFINTVNPSNPASPANPSNPANPANNPGAVQSAAETARNGAWGALAALVLGLLASSLGGLLGGRGAEDDEPVAMRDH
jgi:hypothetical protein